MIAEIVYPKIQPPTRSVVETVRILWDSTEGASFEKLEFLRYLYTNHKFETHWSQLLVKTIEGFGN